MKDPTACEMCGKPLSQFSKGYLCSGSCRMAKSRLKADFGKNLIEAKRHIMAATKALDMDLVSPFDSYEDYNILVTLMRQLVDANEARYQRYLKEPSQVEKAGS